MMNYARAFSQSKTEKYFEGIIITIVIFLDFTQLDRDSHWLIFGHVALTKIKCIPIVIH